VTLVRVAIALILACLATVTQAQTQDLIHERPLHVRHFSGSVVDSKGMMVKYATVELCSPKDHHVLASTFADGNGYFSFDDRKYGKRVEIRVSQKGFNPSRYTAMIRPFGDQHMRLVLHVAA